MLARRPFAFSLRTFFILLTAFAIGLAFVANRAREQREAVAAIENAGGVVAYQDRTDPKYRDEDYDRGFLFHLFHNAVRVMIYSDQLTDATCLDIARLPHLRFVAIAGPMSDAGLESLTQLKKVELLTLHGTRITHAGVSQLQRMKSLYWLELGETPVNDANLRDLARLKKLHRLYISRRSATSQGLDYFQRSLPRCEVKSSRR